MLKTERDLRQEQCVQKWVEAGCKGTCDCHVGFGKTVIGMIAIKRFLAKNPTRSVLIITPSDPIKKQWINYTVQHQVFENCTVRTMYDVSENKYSCDLLIIDEIHRVGTNKILKLFDNIKYKAILGLTATFERLDGKHEIIAQKCPIVDTVTAEEGIAKGWMSKFKEYLVLITPEDYNIYEKLNQEFNEHFSFFNFEFHEAMQCATDWKYRNFYTKSKNLDSKQVLVHAMGFNRTLQGRKKYINNHPRKIELAELILEHRQDKKCITFSNTIAMAEKIKYGKAYSGKDSAKKGRITLEEFANMPTGVLNTVAKLKEGYNDPSLSVSINLGINSSKGTNKQKRGRVTRTAENKEAEVFYLVLKGTVEEKWFAECIGNKDYITIGEDNLLNLLQGNEYIVKKNKETNMLFRF